VTLFESKRLGLLCCECPGKEVLHEERSLRG
jgi:hypothetical protein